MTIVIAIAPALLTPVIVWLLMEFGPERSAIFAIYWLVAAIVFAIAMPWFHRRGRSLVKASVFGAGIAILATSVFFAALLFGFTPRVGAATLVGAGSPVPMQ